MKARNRLGLLFVSAMVFGCGGSTAGQVFDESDTGGTSSEETSTGEDGNPPGSDTTVPGDDTSTPPPIDSGGPPPIDSGATDTGPTIPDVIVPETPMVVPCTEPSGKMYMGHCYFALNPRTYLAARDFCLSLKAHLVTITSAGEQAHVETIGFNDRWIGLLRPEGSPSGASSFKWITGETSSYANWDFGEPNGSGLCARLKDSDGRWGDWQCSQSLPAVCERE